MNRISTAGIAFKEGKVLVALRKPGTSIGESWEFPGGKAEAHETPEDTLRREYMEEFEIEIEVGDLLCRGSFANGEKKYTLLGYRIFPKSDNFVLKEHSILKWVEIGELASLPMASSDSQIADCLLAKNVTSGQLI